MADGKIISGNTEDELWQQVKNDFEQNEDLLEYNAILKQNDKTVVLNIDIDLGGGFESGYETTTLSSTLQTTDDFKFAIHHEHFLDEIGKFFGMQDVIIGYEEFDKKVVVKTNNEERVKKVFSDVETRQVFQSLDSYTLSIHKHEQGNILEFNIDLGITNADRLREIYHAFLNILKAIEDEKL